MKCERCGRHSWGRLGSVCACNFEDNEGNLLRQEPEQPEQPEQEYPTGDELSPDK